MSREQQHRHQVWRIAAKEIALFFATPVAYLFLAAFAAVTLFIFFWAEAFFSRNIADVRPMFEWMPVLLIFLCSTLTMRLWSEERRSGTLEHVLTQPVPLWQFVAGKFAGCVFLLLVALAITLPLPVTVSLIGDLDWGPVWSGYLAALLLGAAYLSIGLFVSSRSDNQIVSLITAVAVCGVFYMVGTDTITSLFGTTVGEWLRLFGTGARFESITRGVIDLRDLYYYLSIVLVFLSLNTFMLERERWSQHGERRRHDTWRHVTALLVLNVLAANLWLGQIGVLRVDTTEGNQYSISEATRNQLSRLQEPLLLRGYFSSKTHPLLAPLVPQLRDMMREYEVAGGGRVRVEFVDPVSDPELEQEANQQYGIEAVPFQVADRYSSSIVSSYFNVLVQYGDEYEVLGYEDLIEVMGGGVNGELDVRLGNPEYDLTRTIRSVFNEYQSGGNLFDTVSGELAFVGYVSPEQQLPEELRSLRQEMASVLQEYVQQSDGRLSVRFVDPDANGGETAQFIASEYGLQPMAMSLLDPQSFYFYPTLQREDGQMVQIPLGDLDADSFRENLEAGIKRFADGFTRTVALVTPDTGPSPGAMPMGMGGAPTGPQFRQLRSYLGEDLNIQDEDLGDGRVSGDADILVLLAPESLDEKSLFAVDQFLMRGGTVVAATSPYRADLSGNALRVSEVDSGLQDWLAHHGLSLGQSLVMDPRNAAFPVPVSRNVGGFSMRDWRMLDYPYFVDVRESGLNAEHLVTRGLPQVTLAWSSPIRIEESADGERQVTTLLRSSDEAWLSDSLDVMPTLDASGQVDFSAQGEQSAHHLAVLAEGRFESWFAGKPSPLLAEEEPAAEQSGSGQQEAGQEAGESVPATVSGVIGQSADSARILLVSSSDFLSDQVLQLLSSAGASQYLNSLDFMANGIDYALEDASLLSIRSRRHFNRTLPPMEEGTQKFLEYGNYALSGLALVLAAVLQRGHATRRRRHHEALFGIEGA